MGREPSAVARLGIARTFDGDELLPLMRGIPPTILKMLPAALITLIRDHNAKQGHFSSLRLCLSGGEKVSADLEEEFANMVGIQIHEL